MAEESGTEQPSSNGSATPRSKPMMPPNQQQHALVQKAIAEFHVGRYFNVKHLPHDITSQEVRAAFEERGENIRELQLNNFTHTVNFSSFREILCTPLEWNIALGVNFARCHDDTF
uniref:Uncharacterized protein n=1 Tax=Strigamia maritima TaxID=126957 RepID=T1INE6_STRMM